MSEKQPGSLKAIALLARENPAGVAAISACLFLCSIMEALGISAIFPLISGVLNTGATLPDSRLADFVNALSARGPYFLAGFIIGSFIIKSLLLSAVMNIVARNVAEFSHKMRLSFTRAMMNARIHFILSKSLGENLSILSNASVNAGSAYISAARVLSGVFNVLLYLAYALWLSTEATLISVLTMGVLVVLVRSTMNRARKAGQKTMQYIHEISRNMGEALRGVKAAKATGNEAHLAAYIYEDSEKLRQAHTANITVAQTLRNIQEPVTITSAIVCLLLFKEGIKLEPGYILFILAVYYRLMGSTNLMLADYQKFLGQENALWSIRQGIEEAEGQKENLETGGLSPPEKTADITYEDISMSFGEKRIFKDLEFTVPARKLTIFQGESGRGKTTAVDMMCGLVDPTEGVIKIAGTPLPHIDKRLWRQKIGYVDQFPFLFQGSVRDNILLDRNDIPDERVKECLSLCHLDKFIEGNADGLDYHLNEGGTNISGGQRQRIAIARAIISAPDYLVLDEPTSALDRESTDVIFRTLKELSASMSVIVITHSHAAEKYADHIIDFDEFQN
jgi:ATP-binding cassette subfamily C protein